MRIRLCVLLAVSLLPTLNAAAQLLPAPGTTPAPAEALPRLVDLSTLSDDERKALVPRLSKPELARIIEATPIEVLISLGRRSVAGLGTYRATMTKQERVKGKMPPIQVLEATIRQAPFAATLYFREGPGKGRRVLYDAAVRPKELRVREGGFLGVMALWIDIDGSLAKADTRHTIRNMGFGSLLDIFGRDVELAGKLGGFERTIEGFNGKGQHCILYKAPPGVTSNYSEKTRVCIDPFLGLPMHMMSYDKDGLFEDVSYADVQANVGLAPDYFTTKAHGL